MNFLLRWRIRRITEERRARETAVATAPVFAEVSSWAAGNALFDLNVGTSSRVGVADMDADGDLDVVVGGPRWATRRGPYGAPWVRVGTGQGGFGLTH